MLVIQVIGCMANGLNNKLLDWYSSHDLSKAMT